MYYLCGGKERRLYFCLGIFFLVQRFNCYTEHNYELSRENHVKNDLIMSIFFEDLLFIAILVIVRVWRRGQYENYRPGT